MSQINRILVPTDYTAFAHHAYGHAVHLAQQHGATVHVLHVIEQKITNPGDVLQEALIKKQNRAERGEDKGMVVYAQRHAASAAEGILAYAQAYDIDLIVMSTQGPFSHGDVAEKIARMAPCPVLTLRAGTASQPGQDIRRILVPVDFSYASPPLIAQAKAWAAAHDASLDLLHVMEGPRVPAVYNPDRFLATVPMVAPKAKKALEKLASHVEGPDVPFRCHVRAGEPARAILNFAERQGIDLIMIASHGHRSFQWRYLGHVAEEVVRETPCPVVTVKPLEKSLLTTVIVEDYEPITA